MQNFSLNIHNSVQLIQLKGMIGVYLTSFVTFTIFLTEVLELEALPGLKLSMVSLKLIRTASQP